MISFLKFKDVPEFSRFIIGIIKDIPYYSREAKREEIKNFEVDFLSKNLKDKRNLYLITNNNKSIVGSLNGYYDAGTFWIDWLAVDIKNRRSGVARKLIKFLEMKLKKKRVHKIWFDTRANNIEAIKFFKKLGFKQAALLKKHWYKQDFYIWEKSLK